MRRSMTVLTSTDVNKILIGEQTGLKYPFRRPSRKHAGAVRFTGSLEMRSDGRG